MAQGQAPFEKLVKSFDRYYSDHPIEKVYLHTDKPYYAVGDTVWFKGYVVEGERHIPSTISAALYIELINDSESVVSSLKLPMINGLAKGFLPLSPSLLEGNYRLRAYTQWMRNEGPLHFYDQIFQIGDPSPSYIKASAQFENQNGKKYIVINYQNPESQSAPQGQRVEYVLQAGDRYYTGDGETDEQGTVWIDVTRHAGDSSFRVESNLHTDNETLINKFLLRQIESEPEVIFFPEGGEMITGIRGRVAVKATGSNGRGLQISGKVSDQDGRQVAEWNTLHAGMGFFYLEPAARKQYEAEVVFEDGSIKTYPLPQAADEGVALSVVPEVTADSVLVRIFSATSGNSSRKLNLLVQSSGQVIGTVPLAVDRPLVQAFIDKDLFGTGVAQFTLFDEQGKPLAERIAFIERPDTLHIDIRADGPHRTRDSTVLSLTVMNAEGNGSISNLSVAVIDEDRVPVKGYEENNIFTQLLLRSDIRGYIENPSYYFDQSKTERKVHLDLLMMTHGYRKFNWQAMLADSLHQPAIQPEPLTDHISGRLVNMRGQPVEGGEVILHSNAIALTRSVKTDKDGKFIFDHLFFAGPVDFSLKARNAKGRNTVEIILDKEIKEPVNRIKNRSDLETDVQSSISAYLDFTEKRDREFASTDTSNMLNPVDVFGRRKGFLTIGGSPIPMSQIDHIIKLNPTDACKNLLECIRQWVPKLRISYQNAGATYQRSSIRPITGGVWLGDNSAHQMTQNHMQQMESRYSGSSVGPTLLSNGYPMSVFLNGYMFSEMTEVRDMLLDKDLFDPSLIETIYVKEYDGTGTSIRSFLYIQTKDETMRPPTFSPDMVTFQREGYSYFREFYSPRYKGDALENQVADYRSTIYWNPELITDKSGTVRFNYFNAGTPGRYRVLVEGISDKGQLGRAVFHYQVK